MLLDLCPIWVFKFPTRISDTSRAHVLRLQFTSQKYTPCCHYTFPMMSKPWAISVSILLVSLAPVLGSVLRSPQYSSQAALLWVSPRVTDPQRCQGSLLHLLPSSLSSHSFSQGLILSKQALDLQSVIQPVLSWELQPGHPAASEMPRFSILGGQQFLNPGWPQHTDRLQVGPLA